MSFRDIAGLEGSGLRIHTYGNHHTWEIQAGTDISGILKEEENYQALINDVSWFETQPGGIRRIFPMFDGQMQSASKTEENYNDLTNTNWGNLTAPNNINGKITFVSNTDLSGASFNGFNGNIVSSQGTKWINVSVNSETTLK